MIMISFTIYKINNCHKISIFKKGPINHLFKYIKDKVFKKH